MTEHFRPDGSLAQGYYCARCGAPGLGMMGSDRHGIGKCLANPLLVADLYRANLPARSREMLLDEAGNRSIFDDVDAPIDTSDIPEVGEDWFKRARLHRMRKSRKQIPPPPDGDGDQEGNEWIALIAGLGIALTLAAVLILIATLYTLNRVSGP